MFPDPKLERHLPQLALCRPSEGGELFPSLMQLPERDPFHLPFTPLKPFLFEHSTPLILPQKVPCLLHPRRFPPQSRYFFPRFRSCFLYGFFFYGFDKAGDFFFFARLFFFNFFANAHFYDTPLHVLPLTGY